MKQFLKSWLYLVVPFIATLLGLLGLIFIGSLLFKTEVGIAIFAITIVTLIIAYIQKDYID